MKTKNLFFILLLLSTTIVVNAKNDIAYVVTNNDTVICSNISFNATNALVTLKDGQTIELKQDELKSFKMDGKIYERKIVYNNYIPTEKTAYLELLGVNNGMKLYVYKFTEGGEWNKRKGVYSGGHEINQLLVYKENDLYLRVPDSSKKTILDFFNVKDFRSN